MVSFCFQPKIVPNMHVSGLVREHLKKHTGRMCKLYIERKQSTRCKNKIHHSCDILYYDLAFSVVYAIYISNMSLFSCCMQIACLLMI